MPPFASQARPPVFQQPHVPTHEEIEARVRATRPGIKLYQPTEDWHKIEFNGDDYWIPPDLEGHPMVDHPVETQRITEDGIRIPKRVKADGTLEAKDRYGEYWKDGAYGTSPNRRKVVGIITSATDFMSFILLNHAQYGVTCLTGVSPEEDEKEKAVARNNYHLYFRRRAKGLVQERGAFIHKWMKDPATKDRPLPGPNAEQQYAQEFLDYIASTTKTLGRYACECGYFQGDNFDAYARHVKVNHKKIVTREQADTELRSRGFEVPNPLPEEPADDAALGEDNGADEQAVAPGAMAAAIAEAQSTWPKVQAYDKNGDPILDSKGDYVMIPVFPTAASMLAPVTSEEIPEHIGSGAGAGEGAEVLSDLDNGTPPLRAHLSRKK